MNQFEFQSGINISGLGDDIFNAMMQNAQHKIIDKILSAAMTGLTSCTVESKGLTPTFLQQLEQEGISNLNKDDNQILLFWEF